MRSMKATITRDLASAASAGADAAAATTPNTIAAHSARIWNFLIDGPHSKVDEAWTLAQEDVPGQPFSDIGECSLVRQLGVEGATQQADQFGDRRLQVDRRVFLFQQRFQLPACVGYGVHEVSTNVRCLQCFRLYSLRRQYSKSEAHPDSSIQLVHPTGPSNWEPAPNCDSVGAPREAVSPRHSRRGKFFSVTATNSVMRFLHRRAFLLHFAPACVREHHA